jgi:hypothetical protein
VVRRDLHQRPRTHGASIRVGVLLGYRPVTFPGFDILWLNYLELVVTCVGCFYCFSVTEHRARMTRKTAMISDVWLHRALLHWFEKPQEEATQRTPARHSHLLPNQLYRTRGDHNDLWVRLITIYVCISQLLCSQYLTGKHIVNACSAATPTCAGLCAP